MSDNSRIEWCDATWNPVTGCTPVSAGCAHCYAERHALRMAGQFGYPKAPHHFDVTLHLDRLKRDKPNHPQRWRIPRRILVPSMGDLFHEDVPDEFIAEVFGAMMNANWHTYFILTKRPERMAECWHGGGLHLGAAHHILPGTSVEDQETANERISELVKIRGARLFVSYEPALGPVNFVDVAWANNLTLSGLLNRQWGKLHWIIAGGETGPNARPAHPTWFRSVRDQCIEAGVPFFFKQWGSTTYKTACKTSGRLLDGREWNEMPAMIQEQAQSLA